MRWLINDKYFCKLLKQSDELSLQFFLLCLYSHHLFRRHLVLRRRLLGRRAAVPPAEILSGSSTTLPLYLLGVLDAPLSRQPGEDTGQRFKG